MVYSFRGITPKIHSSVFLTPSAEVIGDVEIGADSSLWFNVVVRGDVNTIRIGAGTNVQDGSILHVTYKKAALNIGNNVSIGHSVTLHGCTIKDFVLVGMRAVVMDHAEVGEECIIGAGSLVTQDTKIPPRSMVMGSPAKVVRALTDEEIKFLHQSAENYKKYVKWYRESGFKEGQ
jgi:carbonic anhydrase/acetyltransferase-like protein (isoleucine patch superfamily)